MEEMNMIEMAETAAVDAPVAGAEAEGSKVGGVVAAAAGVAVVIGLWEGAKWLGKRAAAGVKKLFKKKAEVDETEVEPIVIEDVE